MRSFFVASLFERGNFRKQDGTELTKNKLPQSAFADSSPIGGAFLASLFEGGGLRSKTEGVQKKALEKQKNRIFS